jgi:hypothetical protein
MVPQWPRVVTAIMLQLPSNLAAIAGGAEQMIAEAAARAKAGVRLRIIAISHATLWKDASNPGVIAKVVGLP